MSRSYTIGYNKHLVLTRMMACQMKIVKMEKKKHFSGIYRNKALIGSTLRGFFEKFLTL